MSKFLIQKPIIHLPNIPKTGVPYEIIAERMLENKIQPMLKPYNMHLDNYYWFTTLEGWGKILYDLVFSSNLYREDVFDCENYALKAMTLCAERHGLNTLFLCLGNIPAGYHGFNIFPFGKGRIDGMKLWEPNAGFEYSGEPFGIGHYGYLPELVLI